MKVFDGLRGSGNTDVVSLWSCRSENIKSSCDYICDRWNVNATKNKTHYVLVTSYVKTGNFYK